MFVCLNWNWNMVFLALPKFTAGEFWKLMVPHVALVGKCFWARVCTIEINVVWI